MRLVRRQPFTHQTSIVHTVDASRPILCADWRLLQQTYWVAGYETLPKLHHLGLRFCATRRSYQRRLPPVAQGRASSDGRGSGSPATGSHQRQRRQLHQRLGRLHTTSMGRDVVRPPCPCCSAAGRGHGYGSVAIAALLAAHTTGRDGSDYVQ